jgi:hypothetical protein
MKRHVDSLSGLCEFGCVHKCVVQNLNPTSNQSSTGNAIVVVYNARSIAIVHWPESTDNKPWRAYNAY